MRAEIESKMVSPAAKAKLRRSRRKIRFLTRDRELFDQRFARALSATHRYRNETQHRNKVRKEMLEPVVRILFEIVTDLLVSLGGRCGTGIVNLADTKWLERYGITS